MKKANKLIDKKVKEDNVRKKKEKIVESSKTANQYRMSKKILGFLKMLSFVSLIVYFVIFSRTEKYISRYIHINAVNIFIITAVILFIAFLPFLKAYIVYRWNILNIDDTGITVITGILSRSSRTISFAMLDEIVININPWQRIFNIGNVRFIPAGETPVEFKNIDDPDKVRQDVISRSANVQKPQGFLK